MSKKKRKYTFRKDEFISYESGSEVHQLKKGLKRKKKEGII